MVRWLAVALAGGIFLIVGCTHSARDTAPDSQIAALQAENRKLREQVGVLTERSHAAEAQVQRQEQDLATRRGQLNEALHSPGYEAVLRLVYAHLAQGDDGVLRDLLPVDQPVEAGIQQQGRSTYRSYASAHDLDLHPFVVWAKQHPLATGQVSVIATMPGYAWAVVSFPDGTHFRIFCSGWQVTKVLASDQPIAMT